MAHLGKQVDSRVAWDTSAHKTRAVGGIMLLMCLLLTDKVRSQVGVLRCRACNAAEGGAISVDARTSGSDVLASLAVINNAATA